MRPSDLSVGLVRTLVSFYRCFLHNWRSKKSLPSPPIYQHEAKVKDIKFSLFVRERKSLDETPGEFIVKDNA